MRLKTKIFSAVMAGYFAIMGGFIAIANAAWEMKDLVCYLYTTDSTIKVGWTPVPAATSYDVRLQHWERKVYINKGNTLTTEVIFTLPKTGHWVVEVRGKNQSATGVWSQATSPLSGTVDGQARGWWLYGYAAPVGPITIGWIKNNFKNEGEINYG